MSPEQRARHPSVARIASIARALGDVRSDVVFIGGAIAPLLQTLRTLPSVRPTRDVDAVFASTTYVTYAAMETRLRALGFRTDVSDTRHVHRWLAPDGTPFDLVPAGAHPGGTGSVLDRAVVEAAVELEIEPDLVIRHASAAGFLALKWAAFQDRGFDDPFRSEDLEDILALMVSRDGIVDEVLLSPVELRQRIQTGFAWLTQHAERDDLFAAYLGHASGFTALVARLEKHVALILGE